MSQVNWTMIKHPTTGKSVSILEKKGQEILRGYVNYLQGGALENRPQSGGSVHQWIQCKLDLSEETGSMNTFYTTEVVKERILKRQEELLLADKALGPDDKLEWTYAGAADFKLFYDGIMKAAAPAVAPAPAPAPAAAPVPPAAAKNLSDQYNKKKPRELPKLCKTIWEKGYSKYIIANIANSKSLGGEGFGQWVTIGKNTQRYALHSDAKQRVIPVPGYTWCWDSGFHDPFTVLFALGHHDTAGSWPKDPADEKREPEEEE